MKVYKALVVKMHEHIEEEVELIVNGISVTCFASICPYEIYEGVEYDVNISAMIFDEYYVKKAASKIKRLKKLNNGFSYLLTGKLTGADFDCGIKFSDEILLSDYGYLDNEYVDIKIDRIDVEFLEQV